MPKLKTYDAGAAASSVINTRRAQGSDFGGGAGLEIAGKALMGYAEQLKEGEERKAGLHREETIANDRLELSTRLKDKAKNLPHGGLGSAEQMKTEMDDYFKARRGTMTTTRATEDYDLQATRLRARMMGKAIDVEAAASARQQVGALKSVFNSTVNAVRAGDMTPEEGVADSARVANSTTLGEAKKEELRVSQTEAVWAAEVDRMLSPDNLDTAEDAFAVQEALEDPKWQERLSPKAYKAALNKAEKTSEQYEDRDQKSLITGLAETSRELAEGVGLENANSVLASVAQIKDPDQRSRAEKAVRSAITIGTATKSVEGGSPAQVDKLIKQAEKDVKTPGDGDRDRAKDLAVKRAVATHKKRLKTDPAAYAYDVNPTVTKAEDAYRADPTPETFKAKVEAQTAAQTFMGVDASLVKVLTKTEVESVRTQLRGVATDDDAAKGIHGLLVDLQEKSGKSWPLVNKQLQDDKVFSGVETEVAGMVRMDQRQAALDLLTAGALTDKELEPFIPNFEKTKTAISDKVRNSLSGLSRTLNSRVAGSEDAYRRVSGSVEKLALYYVRGGDSVNDAVEKASKSVILSNYTFAGSYRIPVGEGIAVGDVHSQGRRTIRRLQPDELITPPSIFRGLPEKTAQDSYARSLLTSSTWQTNGDESGVILVDGTGSPVKYKRGGAVEMLWGDMLYGTTREVPGDIDAAGME